MGGQYLAIASGEYEYYFKEDWGAAVFVDAGDAFTDGFSLNVGAGVGLRWRSPLGPVRIDVGFPVQTELDLDQGWRLHRCWGRTYELPARAANTRLDRRRAGTGVGAGGVAGELAAVHDSRRALGGEDGDATVRAAGGLWLARRHHRGRTHHQDFRFEGGADTARIRINRMTVDPTLRMLLSRTLRIDRATVTGLTFTLPEQPEPDEPDQPLWVEPPLEVVVNDFALVDGRVFDGREQLVSVKQLECRRAGGARSCSSIALTLLPGDIDGTLDVQGRITPSGNLVRGQLDANWQKVVIPAKFAGRELATDGELHFDGTPEAYAVKKFTASGRPAIPRR